MCIREECRMIIFGSGDFGKRALDFLGSENVLCFCDNSASKTGTQRHGKKVISFEELKAKYSDFVVVIAVYERQTVYKIAKQCEENGIEDYLVYDYLSKLFKNREDVLAYIESDLNRMKIRKELNLERVRTLENQVAYFKNHADIRCMLPAVGVFRERQCNTVKNAALFWQRLSALNIRPILDWGNLLGYVRHNGFVPWDDDMDFSLLRREYDCFKAYCQEHIYTIEEFFEGKKADRKSITPGLEDYYWVDAINQITINRHSPEIHSVFDVFSLEYYQDGYSLEELREFAAKVWYEFLEASSATEKRKCMEAARRANRHNTAEESDNIYFGIDNVSLLLSGQYHRGGFIPKDVVFPLKKVIFEGEYFWGPNNPEEFLKYEYRNIWEFPDDVGLPKHVNELA